MPVLILCLFHRALSESEPEGSVSAFDRQEHARGEYATRFIVAYFAKAIGKFQAKHRCEVDLRRGLGSGLKDAS